MTFQLPGYLQVEASALGRESGVAVRRTDDAASLAVDMAEEMFDFLKAGIDRRRPTTMIVPVGPVDQFPILAEKINADRLDCREAVLINMDEYLDDDDRLVPVEHPLSFRGYMNFAFYERLDPALAPLPQYRVFPDPADPGAIERWAAARGGIDVCFGGIGINGHIAFNEPPEPGESASVDEFAGLPTRVLSLARETRTINSVTVGGEIAVIPRRAVTVGMREILASRALRFYCNRPWQSAVVRQVLHEPIAASCPASLLRTHADAALTVTRQVAERPDIRLR